MATSADRGEARPAARAGQRRQPDLPATCTRRPGTSSERASRRPGRCGPARSTTPPTSPVACTTRCRTGPAASASTTTWPWRSGGCWTTARRRSPTSTSTCTTATAWRRIFYDDPRVLTISLHETGQMLFPGTGFPADAGGPEALGSAVNVALPPGTSDAGWLRAFHAVVPPLLREFAPDILVTQHGCDSHRDDPLAHLALSVDGQRASYLALHDLAHEVGRRSLGRLRRRRLRDRRRGPPGVDPPARRRLRDPARHARSRRPLAWREEIRERLGVRAPSRMTDGRNPAYPRLVAGLRPGHLAGPRDPGHPRRRVPLQRPRSASCESLNQSPWQAATPRSH